jgi:hypothetical protein
MTNKTGPCARCVTDRMTTLRSIIKRPCETVIRSVVVAVHRAPSRTVHLQLHYIEYPSRPERYQVAYARGRGYRGPALLNER